MSSHEIDINTSTISRQWSFCLCWGNAYHLVCNTGAEQILERWLWLFSEERERCSKKTLSGEGPLVDIRKSVRVAS